jgi:M6 family metalloprotease-like protein
MPEKIGYYNIQAEGTRVFESEWYRESVRLADPFIDFSDVDVILISGPPQKEADVWRFTAEAAKPIDTYSIQYTDEKPIYNILVRGEDNRPDRIKNWIHEFGHMLGLTDFNHGGSDYQTAHYDIMTAYDNMELYSWNRFILGAITSANAECKTTKTESTHMLSPVAEQSSKNKAVMIPLSKNKVLVAESRRPIGYDSQITSGESGVVVYYVDTTIKSQDNAIKVLSPDTRPASKSSRALKPGESISYEGYTITVLESGSLADLISIVYN